MRDEFNEIYTFLNCGDDKKFEGFINNHSKNQIDNLKTASHLYHYFNLVVDKRAIPLKTVLMVFVIEGAIFDENIDFYQWLRKNNAIDSMINKNKMELIQQIELLHKNYKEDYGCNRKFVKLFKENLDYNEKLNLLRSFEIEDMNGSNEFRHFCHEPVKGCCNYVRCYLNKQESDIDTYIEKISKMIYGFRSCFVHEAEIKQFTFEPKNIELYECFLLGSYNNKKLLKIKLAYETFERLVKKMLCRYFEGIGGRKCLIGKL